MPPRQRGAKIIMQDDVAQSVVNSTSFDAKAFQEVTQLDVEITCDNVRYLFPSWIVNASRVLTTGIAQDISLNPVQSPNSVQPLTSSRSVQTKEPVNQKEKVHFEIKN